MFVSAAGFASEAIKGINILKSGSDPEIKPDEQYPQWVWQVGSPGKMLSQLNREQEDPEQETTMEEVNTVGGPSTIIDIWLHVRLQLAESPRGAILKTQILAACRGYLAVLGTSAPTMFSHYRHADICCAAMPWARTFRFHLVVCLQMHCNSVCWLPSWGQFLIRCKRHRAGMLKVSLAGTVLSKLEAMTCLSASP